MGDDAKGMLGFLLLLAVVMGMPASCSMVHTQSAAQKVCIEARAKNIPLLECKPIMNDKDIIDTLAKTTN